MDEIQKQIKKYLKQDDKVSIKEFCKKLQITRQQFTKAVHKIDKKIRICGYCIYKKQFNRQTVGLVNGVAFEASWMNTNGKRPIQRRRNQSEY